MSLITIFTPTYNRCKLLTNLYSSLEKQTNKDFLWLIIDDGSTDKTEYQISEWLKKNTINIKYIKQVNSGKHAAYNHFLSLVHTKFFMIVDSDDCLENNAVENILKMIPKIDNENIWALVGPRKHYDGTISPVWNFKNGRSKFSTLYTDYGYKGETYLVMNTKLVRNIKFPIFENEKFVPESAVYDQLDNLYDIYLNSKALYIFDYLPDGYTFSGIDFMKKNINGFCYANMIRAILLNYPISVRIMSYARFKAMKRLSLNPTYFKDFRLNDINYMIKLLGNIYSVFFYFNYKFKFYIVGRK